MQAVCAQGPVWQTTLCHTTQCPAGDSLSSSSSDQPGTAIDRHAARPLRRRRRKCACIPTLVDQQIHAFSKSAQQQAPRKYSPDL